MPRLKEQVLSFIVGPRQRRRVGMGGFSGASTEPEVRRRPRLPEYERVPCSNYTDPNMPEDNRGRSVTCSDLRGDSVSALQWANTSRFNSESVNRAAILFTLLLVRQRVVIANVEHVAGECNGICDDLSRRDVTGAFRTVNKWSQEQRTSKQQTTSEFKRQSDYAIRNHRPLLKSSGRQWVG